MFFPHPIPAALDDLLHTLPDEVSAEVRGVYTDYETLLKSASRDREALLGFLDVLGFRLDDLPVDPTAARQRAKNLAASALDAG